MCLDVKLSCKLRARVAERIETQLPNSECVSVIVFYRYSNSYATLTY